MRKSNEHMLRSHPMRPLIPLAAVLCLTACAQMGRLPGMTDSQCVRWEMAHGSNVSGALPFDGAASRCEQFTEGTGLTEAGAHQIPLDLRDDPALQAMAEDPSVNDAGYAFIPRNSTLTPAGKRWHIMQ